jgi:ABC-2 type transport system ATP-binding protein
MSNPALSAQNLSKHYNGVPALDGLNLDIPQGNIGLLGENGAGKSTFIKLSLGLIRPTSGTASVLGLPVSRQSLEIRRLVGYMPEDDCLPPDMSALDFSVRMGMLSGLPRENALQRAYDVLHLVGLGEERYRNMGGYSVGMKQRAKLAQALVHDPKLVLLDEPTSGLDPAGRDEMLELIKDIRDKMGISLLLSTHLLLDVERVCDHVVIIRAGKVVSNGPLSNLLQETSEGLQVRVVGDVDRFVNALKQAGVAAQEFGGELLLQAEGDAIYDIVLETAVATGVQLRKLEVKGRSLEEHFITLHDEQ